MSIDPDDKGIPRPAGAEPPIQSGLLDNTDVKSASISANQAKGLQRIAGWMPTTGGALLSKIPRLTRTPHKLEADTPSMLTALQDDAAIAPPNLEDAATSIQLHQTIAAAITKALSGWTGYLGGQAGGHVIRLTAERFTATIIARTGTLLKEAANDPDLHKVAVTLVKQAVIEAAFMAGGRLGGNAMEGVANNVAERFLRVLDADQPTAATGIPRLELIEPAEQSIADEAGDQKRAAPVDPDAAQIRNQAVQRPNLHRLPTPLVSPTPAPPAPNDRAKSQTGRQR